MRPVVHWSESPEDPKKMLKAHSGATCSRWRGASLLLQHTCVLQAPMARAVQAVLCVLQAEPKQYCVSGAVTFKGVDVHNASSSCFLHPAIIAV